MASLGAGHDGEVGMASLGAGHDGEVGMAGSRGAGDVGRETWMGGIVQEPHTT
jgi:hypothetical protein